MPPRCGRASSPAALIREIGSFGATTSQSKIHFSKSWPARPTAARTFRAGATRQERFYLRNERYTRNMYGIYNPPKRRTRAADQLLVETDCLTPGGRPRAPKRGSVVAR